MSAARVCAVLLACAAFTAGCGADGREPPPEGARSLGGRAASVEQLAAAIGCAASVQSDNTELRQGGCRTEDGRYVVTTFAGEDGKRAWLDAAMPYGGSYLVGRRWVVTGAATALAAAREKLGGTVEKGDEHHG